jgi:uncharacterized DUF497 family protein
MGKRTPVRDSDLKWLISVDTQMCSHGCGPSGREPEEARGNSRRSSNRLQRPTGLDWDDFEHSDSERRSVKLGFSAAGRVLFVVYEIRRLKHGKETIRIISARQATRKERKVYAG